MIEVLEIIGGVVFAVVLLRVLFVFLVLWIFRPFL